MISNKDFEKVIDCLPEGFTWGQALTPHIALHIVNAALASQEPTLKNNEFIPDSTEGRIQAAIKCLNMHWVSHDANRFDYAIEGLEKCLASLASQAQQPDWLLKSTQDLATSLWQKYYKSESPVFEVLNDLAGVISQIDNMTTGLVRLQSQAQQEPKAWLVRERSKRTGLLSNEILVENKNHFRDSENFKYEFIPLYSQQQAPTGDGNVMACSKMEITTQEQKTESKQGCKECDGQTYIHSPTGEYLGECPFCTKEEEPYAYDVPTKDGTELAYAIYFTKYNNPLPEGAIPLYTAQQEQVRPWICPNFMLPPRSEEVLVYPMPNNVAHTAFHDGECWRVTEYENNYGYSLVALPDGFIKGWMPIPPAPEGDKQ